MTIGILALQGAFYEHEKKLEQLGIDYIELRQRADLEKPFDGLILPGGESTVQGKLLHELDMFNILKGKISSGLPVLATCAGMILLADEISNDEKAYFKTIPMTVRRNAYGRQLGSFHIQEQIRGLGEIPMTFIRAPFVCSYAPDVEVLATYRDRVVAVKYHNQIALSFHPELDNDNRIYTEMYIPMLQ